MNNYLRCVKYLLFVSVLDFAVGAGVFWTRDLIACPFLWFFCVEIPGSMLSWSVWLVLVVLGLGILFGVVFTLLTGTIATEGVSDPWWDGNLNFLLDAPPALGSDLTMEEAYACMEMPVGSHTPAQLKKAYRIQCRKWHPDKNGGDLRAKERFQRIQDAQVS